YHVALRVTDDLGAQSTSTAIVRVSGKHVIATSPEDGDSFRSGDTVALRWESTSPVATVSLLVSLKGGKGWTEVAAGLPEGRRSWDGSAREVAKAASRCRVKVVGYDAAGKLVASDTSAGAFALTP